MKRSRKIFLAVLTLISIRFAAIAQEMPNTPRPNPPRLVNDFANVMSADERAQLERKLVAFDDSTSNQIAIVTLRTLNGFPIEEYALRTLRDWGIGNARTNNGVLIVAAIDDRKVRIETGYGLEGAIPDITASAIIRNDIAPSFRDGNYFEGFSRATESIIQAAAGEYKAPRERATGGPGMGGLVLAAIVLIIIFSSINRRGSGGGGFMSRRGFRGGLGPLIFLPGMMGRGRGGGFGGGGFGGGGFGGGGFGGFGGGMGGGGGASGGW
jgi:uncharacterized protein